MSELLAPAGSLEAGKVALYSGADALYLALDRFGARAYAKNFTFPELNEIISTAHVLGKKVYVTINTIIKNDELDDVYDYIDMIYKCGVDAIICADIAVYMYIINNCKGMDAHISTQAGVKDLYDALFFEQIGAHRVVVAREDSFEEIKYIKENSNIELEVFIHGALCVSYSGGCLFSSLLSLRSGNRGRCSQNCRREYVICENDTPITKPGYYLSMKDLCASNNVTKLSDINVDSLKIEGRMKNPTYVKNVTTYYRDLLDGKDALKDNIDQSFHRQFTKGFLFGEDKANIATIKDSSSTGKKIGVVTKVENNKVYLKLSDEVRVRERIRFELNDNSTYITVEAIKGNIIETKENIKVNSIVYKMQDNELNNFSIDTDKIGLYLYVNAFIGSELSITASFNDRYYIVSSIDLVGEAINKPTTEEVIYKQLNKLNDTPFYIRKIEYNMDSNIYLSVSSINEVRRRLVEEIYNDFKNIRDEVERQELFLKPRGFDLGHKFIAYVETKEQNDACSEMGLKTIFFENYSPYVNAKYHEINEEEVLVGSYGGIYKYSNKALTSDYTFNVINKDSILHLLNLGIRNVTLSYEMSYQEIKSLANDFLNTYHMKAPLDMIIYGKQRLMSMKYCPLKKLGLCGKCRKNKYTLKDKFGSFIIKSHDDCYTEILNSLPLNLIDEIPSLTDYINRFRFQFTTESKEEVKSIINDAYRVLNEGISCKKANETRGHFKRSII